MKIKIVKNGPYIVSGSVPIKKRIIAEDNLGYTLKDGKALPQGAVYAVCRCGKSKTMPFCDGTHVKISFDGTETADRRTFFERAEKTEGKKVDLLDDGRCALARFCHRGCGKDVWELVEEAENEEGIAEAVKGANECPAGRLVVAEKDGTLYECEEPPQLDILSDDEMECGGALIVRGAIPIESSDGFVYEKRPRVALCRCGASANKPFCDASHVYTEFKG
jgi:CDGSH-type Zn-finger protein